MDCRFLFNLQFEVIPNKNSFTNKTYSNRFLCIDFFKISGIKKLGIIDLIKVDEYLFTSKYLQIANSIIREIKNENIIWEIICLYKRLKF